MKFIPGDARVPPDQSGERQFVLQAIDPAIDCPVLEARFNVMDMSELRALLAGEDRDDPDLRASYPLDSDQILAIASSFAVAFDPGDRPVMLAAWHSGREVPYLVHTGFELPLMLEGRKPLSKFSDFYPSCVLDDVMSRFEPFVRAGHLACRIVNEPWPTPRRQRDGTVTLGIREVYFTLPGQEWRIDANRLLFEVAVERGWNDTLERLEGRLLGYEEWQNDWWLGRGVLSWQRKRGAAS